MHALGYGTPVLLHDKVEEHFPEWEAVKEGETGWFYRYDDLSDCAEKVIDALFPISCKPAMATACRSVISSRYNTSTHADLFVKSIAQHCAFPARGVTTPQHSDSAVPCGSFEDSVSVKEG